MSLPPELQVLGPGLVLLGVNPKTGVADMMATVSRDHVKDISEEGCVAVVVTSEQARALGFEQVGPISASLVIDEPISMAPEAQP